MCTSAYEVYRSEVPEHYDQWNQLDEPSTWRNRHLIFSPGIQVQLRDFTIQVQLRDFTIQVQLTLRRNPEANTMNSSLWVKHVWNTGKYWNDLQSKRMLKEMDTYPRGIWGQQNNQYGPLKEKNYHMSLFCDWHAYYNDNSILNIQTNTCISDTRDTHNNEASITVEGNKGRHWAR